MFTISYVEKRMKSRNNGFMAENRFRGRGNRSASLLAKIILNHKVSQKKDEVEIRAWTISMTIPVPHEIVLLC